MKKALTILILIFVLAFGVVAMSACNGDKLSPVMGYTIYCNTAQYSEYFSTAELTVKTAENFIELYCHTIWRSSGDEDLNYYYIINEAGSAYVIQYRTYYVGGELYKTGYGIYVINKESELPEGHWDAFWLENNNFGSVENMNKLLEFLFLTTDVAIPESNEDFSFTVNGPIGPKREYDETTHSYILGEAVDVLFTSPVEYVIEVKDIGTTPTGVATMPKEVQNFKNMVGQTVEIEGPAYK